MFAQLYNVLTGQRAVAPLADPDEAHALGALLVRMTRVDGCYGLEEVRRIDLWLARLHKLSPQEAVRMRACCEKMERAAPETEIFAQLIRHGIDFDDRQSALEAMWQVVLSEDGAPRAPQKATMRRVQTALGLSDVDSLTARGQAFAKM
ncbi:MAG: TerB family tellurite resistance protein [Thalassovita sp.]